MFNAVQCTIYRCETCVCRPEAFGQHANAEISYLIEDSKALLDGLLGLAPKTSTGSGSGEGGGKRREDLVEAIANDLLDQVRLQKLTKQTLSSRCILAVGT